MAEDANPSVADRQARGSDARIATAPKAHAGWTPAIDRPDPVTLLEEQNATREPDLVPVRHGRMMISPFTFYRGAAKIMATDLAPTPTAGLITQLCGDAHLSNFGVFASPERDLVFDLNDFDETLPGPFEYDVKRMAASFTIAAQNNGLTKAESVSVTQASVRAYRQAMAQFAQMGTLELWYTRKSASELQAALGELAAEAAGAKGPQAGQRAKVGKKPGKKAGKKAARSDQGRDKPTPGGVAWAAKQADKNLRKARTRDSLHALSKLGELVDGKYRIVSQPPIVVPLRDLHKRFGMDEADVAEAVRGQFRDYRAALPDDRRHLLERFEMVDMARKVVGVGSVGTRCWILLMQGIDGTDPLFLQAKEAGPSVIAVSKSSPVPR